MSSYSSGNSRDELLELRPRADEPHLALEHVPQLRQLVEAAACEPAPERRVALVAVRAHRRACGVARPSSGTSASRTRARRGRRAASGRTRIRASRGRRRSMIAAPTTSANGTASTTNKRSSVRNEGGMRSATRGERLSRRSGSVRRCACERVVRSRVRIEGQPIVSRELPASNIWLPAHGELALLTPVALLDAKTASSGRPSEKARRCACACCCTSPWSTTRGSGARRRRWRTPATGHGGRARPDAARPWTASSRRVGLAARRWLRRGSPFQPYRVAFLLCVRSPDPPAAPMSCTRTTRRCCCRACWAPC